MLFEGLHPQLFKLIFDYLDDPSLYTLLETNNNFLIGKINQYLYINTKHYIETKQCEKIDRRILRHLSEEGRCFICNKLMQYHPSSFYNILRNVRGKHNMYYDFMLFDDLKLKAIK